MGSVLHPLLLVGEGAAGGYALVTAALLVREVVDVLAAGRVEQPVVWPDPCSLTVWTGEDWFTVTVMPVAFGRWGIAVRRDEAPRRATSMELVERARSEYDARSRARELVGQALGQGMTERVALVSR
jgi:glycosyltransferase involved in cell wall biosynthesis